MFRKPLLTLVLLAFTCSGLEAQRVRDFKPALDSMQTLLKERTTVSGVVKAKKVIARGTTLDFYLTTEFGDYPWREADVKWFRSTLKSLLPAAYGKHGIGAVYAGKQKLESFVMPTSGSDGKPASDKFRSKVERGGGRLVTRVGSRDYDKGLSGRTVALWQSHGLYYEEKKQSWRWQRAPLFQTVEDMYTQSYVLPFLIPMLENAGAYVITPRERDPQRNEIIADNDPAFTEGRIPGVRTEGRYTESGTWADAGEGFADFKAVYTKGDNPFRAGTARMADSGGGAQAMWVPDIPERGEYSVYISYKSLPNSSRKALYKVSHLGGTTGFLIDQRIGGGTWIYLGTFEFDSGTGGSVTLSGGGAEGKESEDGTVITADAVRFGGGMGKVARGQSDQDVQEYSISGMPSFAEGAYYWMQWAGADSTLLNLQDNDYTSDFADRGAWVGWMSGGSWSNPDEEGLGIPVDLSLAFHSDAGTTPNDSIVGTLSIYTLLCEGSDKLPDGEPRLQSRMYADFVQSQIVGDLRAFYNPDWSRRGLWDRSYSECRTTRTPAMILETLSHQNFADMKFGLDPSFRFAVSRAAYKGMLKYLSCRYGREYVVQPLPVNSFATAFRVSPTPGGAAQIRLSWTPTEDPLEPTARPHGYILQTRIDDGVFDEGEVIEARTSGGRCTYDLTIKPGRIYSYRIVAFNEGGKSFPSEVLSIGVPSRGKGKPVSVVNNFTRVSPPAWFDTPEYAGFKNDLDAGVPYMREINFIGGQYEFRREMAWEDDDNPGFGASYTDQAGTIIPGNTFDFTTIHGKAIMAAGHPFHSMGVTAFMAGACSPRSDMAVDLICGKQVTTPIGGGKAGCRYQVFPEKMRHALEEFSVAGGNILVSGANIGTDVWDEVFPIAVDSLDRRKAEDFVKKTLGYKWMTGYATNHGEVWPMRNSVINLDGKLGKTGFWKEPGKVIYNVETPDGLVPASDAAHSFLRYSDTNISAAVCYDGGGYRTVCLGFPIEVIKRQDDIDALVGVILDYFEKKQ